MIYLNAGGTDSVVVPPLLIANSRKTILSFDFLTLPLFTMDAEMYLGQHRTCMYPLLPTMRGLHADMVTQVMSELSEPYRRVRFVCIRVFQIWKAGGYYDND